MVQYKKETEALAIKKFDAIEKDVLTGKHISFDFKPEVGFLTDRVEDNLGRNSPDLLVMSKNVHSTNKENFDDLVKAIKIPLVLVS